MAARMDMDHLRDQIANLQEQLADMTEEAGHEAGAYRARAARRMRGAYGQARRYYSDAEHVVGARVGRNPIASLLIAFGIGLAIGKLLDLDRS